MNTLPLHHRTIARSHHRTLFLVWLVVALTARVGSAVTDPRQEFAQANQDYFAGRYESAIQRYENLIAEFPRDAVLYFNMGNAFHRLGQMGQAVWCYEMALGLRPGWAEAQHNLDLSRPRGGQVGSLLEQTYHWARDRVAPQTWSWAAAWAWAALLCAAGLAAAIEPGPRRRTLWRLTALAGAAMVLSLVMLVAQHTERSAHPPSVVVADNTAVRSGGGADLGSEMGSLPAGTHVWPVEHVLPSGWVKIRTESGQLGFVDAATLRALTH